MLEGQDGVALASLDDRRSVPTVTPVAALEEQLGDQVRRLELSHQADEARRSRLLSASAHLVLADVDGHVEVERGKAGEDPTPTLIALLLEVELPLTGEQELADLTTERPGNTVFDDHAAEEVAAGAEALVDERELISH